MRQHNLRVTGSLTVNGESVVSASQLSALNSTLTGQYATTGSNSYNGNQTITGSLLVTGVITANEFHTTFVTSSVLYTSGSTKFGDSNDDIMEVTGSLKVNGNITANNLSGIVSSSSQITSLLPTGVVSGSSQTILNLPTGTVSGSSQLTASYDTRYVVSGSITQTTWDNIASKPAGIVSGSSQVVGILLSLNTFTASNDNTSLNQATSSYETKGRGIWSGSAQLPTGIISSSTQVILQSTTGQLSASRVDGLNLTQIGSGSYTASIGQTFNVNTSTIITGSLTVTSLSGSGVNYLAYSGGVITAISGTAAIKYTQEFSASLGQTTFTPSVGYVSGLIDVYYNGTKLSTTDYTATNGSTIILTQGADLAGDIIEVAIYNPVNGVSNNVLRQQTTFTASALQTTFTIGYTPGLLDVYFNGSRLSNEEYTANNGTSIILSEAAIGGEIVDIFVYSYQVGAFSGVGGQGVANQLTYWSSQSGITGSTGLTFDGTNLTVVGISGSIASTNGVVSGSSQVVGILSSLNTATASFTPRITNLESKSASVDISITNINSFTASNGNTSLNSKTGSYATTGSNTFVGTQIISGSTYVQGDLVVYGSSSIQYISASSVSIGTNIVNLNTATPAVRYAGLTVQDSGSAQGVTGSMLWDSCCNRWIYSNPSGVGYSGGVIMSGPRAATFGTETTLTCNYIAKSGGGDHLYDSCIIDDGTTVCVNANLKGSGTACFTGAITGGNTLTTTGDITISNTTTNLRLFLTNTTTTTGRSWYLNSYSNGNLYIGNGTAGDIFNFSSSGVATFSSNITTTSLGIGLTACAKIQAEVGNTTNIGLYTSSGLAITSGGGSTGNIYQISFGYGGGTYGSSALYGLTESATGYNSGALVFATRALTTDSAPIERMRITSGGNVGIGTCNPTVRLDILGNNEVMNIAGCNSISAFTGYYYNTSTLVGYIGNGSSILSGAASSDFIFRSQGALVYATNGNNERLRITCSGNIGIGTTTPQAKLQVSCASNFGAILKISDITTESTGILALGDGGTSTINVGVWRAAANSMSSYGNWLNLGGYDGILFATCAAGIGSQAERMRITNDNVILMGTTSTSPTNSGGMIFRTTNAAYGGVIIMNHSTTNNVGSGFLDLYYNTSYIGGIQQNGASAVLYNTSSDYRIKEDLKDFNGLEKISAIKVYDFKWKTEDTRSHGVIAHELQEVLPYAVGGEKDQLGEDGKLKAQGVDYGKLTPILIKAIQEQQCTIQCLTNRIEQLENN